MGQESTGIDNLEKDLKVEENTEVKKNNERYSRQLIAIKCRKEIKFIRLQRN